MINENTLYYLGQPLDMTKTVKEICVMYPEVKDVLGFFYMIVKNRTLEDLCKEYGLEMIQSKIDEYQEKKMQ